LEALAAIEADTEGSIERLERYIGLYRTVLRKRRMCMCGMLAADVATLPAPMRESVGVFFAENETWLAHVLSQGTSRRELQFAGTPASMAAFIVSSLEGAMLVARGRGEPAHLDDVASLLIANMRPSRTGRPARTR
jgi:TetR/AcrR family transcriptional regulator, transcriptional repressor for nem operon